MYLQIFRSLLFVPANSWRMLLNSLQTEADGLVIDLEDAVPIDDKETGRWFVKEFLEHEISKVKNKSIYVRINSVSSNFFKEDLEFAVRNGLDGIVIAKTESKNDVDIVSNTIKEMEDSRGLDKGKVKIIPLIESAMGVENALEIAGSDDRVVAISFGIGDFLRDMGLSYNQLSSDEHEVLYARSKISVAAAANGISAIDTPFLGLIIDREGLRRQCLNAKKLGFKGKYVIHPTHIPIVNEIFSPTKEEIDEAVGIVEAYKDAVKRGLGATSYKGRMIDCMNYRQAKTLLEQAKLMNLL